MLSAEIAEIMVAHHAYDEAMPLLQRAIADDPNNPRIRAMFGMVLRDRGLLEEAAKELHFAYRLDATDVDIVASLAVLYDMQGDGDKAEIWHRKAIDLSPQRADLYNNLGFSLYLRHRDEDAVAAYNEALRRDPGAHRVFNNLGFAQARLKKFEAALASFSQGTAKPAAYSNMGLAYEMAGNVAAARSMYEEALKLDRKSVVAQRNLNALRAASKTEKESP